MIYRSYWTIEWSINHIDLSWSIGWSFDLIDRWSIDPIDQSDDLSILLIYHDRSDDLSILLIYHDRSDDLSILLIDHDRLDDLSINHIDRSDDLIDPIDRSRSIRMIYWSYRSITIDSDDLLILSIDHDRFGWSIDPIDWSIDRMIYHDRSDDLSRLIKWSIDPNDLSWSIE